MSRGVMTVANAMRNAAKGSIFLSEPMAGKMWPILVGVGGRFRIVIVGGWVGGPLVWLLGGETVILHYFFSATKFVLSVVIMCNFNQNVFLKKFDIL